MTLLILGDIDNIMELRFPEWEKIINEGKLLEVRRRILEKLDILDRELNNSYTSDKRDETLRLKKAFMMLLKFQEELLELKGRVEK